MIHTILNSKAIEYNVARAGFSNLEVLGSKRRYKAEPITKAQTIKINDVFLFFCISKVRLVIKVLSVFCINPIPIRGIGLGFNILK